MDKATSFKQGLISYPSILCLHLFPNHHIDHQIGCCVQEKSGSPKKLSKLYIIDLNC